jgi:hypothetical protein
MQPAKKGKNDSEKLMVDRRGGACYFMHDEIIGWSAAVRSRSRC